LNADQLCRQYLDALEESDLGAVTGLFTADGKVVSPLYGEQPADQFYAALFGDTSRSQTQLIRVLNRPAPDAAIALHFAYRWTLANGETVDFEVVDMLEMVDDGRIAKLTILYDTAPLRAAHEKSRRR